MWTDADLCGPRCVRNMRFSLHNQKGADVGHVLQRKYLFPQERIEGVKGRYAGELWWPSRQNIHQYGQQGQIHTENNQTQHQSTYR